MAVNKRHATWAHDPMGDCHYISLGTGQARVVKSLETESTVIWRYDEYGNVIGITVLGESATPPNPHSV